MNFSRIALPVIGRPIVLRSILDREPGGLAQDPDHDRRGVSAAPEEVAQACGRADGIAPAQRRQAPARHRSRPHELRLPGDGGQRRVDEGGGDPARAELGAEARRTVATSRPNFHPLACEGRVVHVATPGEVGDHLAGHGRGSAAALKAPGELAAGPRPPREKIGRRQARGGGIEEPLRGYDRLKKGLAPAAPARGCMSGGLSSLFCSNDCSPVEKMPRTLRSKSSGLDAASRAVSWETRPSRKSWSRHWSKVCIPYWLWPCAMAAGMSGVRFASRMQSRMSPVAIMISTAGTRPSPPILGIRRCEITPCMTAASWSRICCSWWGGKLPMIRLTVS